MRGRGREREREDGGRRDEGIRFIIEFSPPEPEHLLEKEAMNFNCMSPFSLSFLLLLHVFPSASGAASVRQAVFFSPSSFASIE